MGYSPLGALPATAGTRTGREVGLLVDRNVMAALDAVEAKTEPLSQIAEIAEPNVAQMAISDPAQESAAVQLGVSRGTRARIWVTTS